MFNNNDLNQIQSKQILLEKVNEQIDTFKKGFPYLKVIKAATINDGIKKFDDNKINSLISNYNHYSLQNDIIKFVPASGAASRMFKSLYEFIEIYNGQKSGYDNFMSSNGLKSILHIIQNIKKFAFYNDLKLSLNRKNKDLDKMISVMDYAGIIEEILNIDGLNYGNLPKALLKFHNYKEISRTSLEEHLVEGALYATDKNNEVNIHFTVSFEHKELFKSLVDSVIKKYETQFSVTYNISYSEQKESTDTIAVDLENIPFRNKDNSLLFRPGGHGALIENLNDLNFDIIFIKNIDNIVPDRLKQDTVDYKKAIAGLLLFYQKKIFEYLKKIDTEKSIKEETILEIENFIKDEISFIFPESYDSLNKNDKINFLQKILNRPIRVCGMVKNEGEPGGGPFWAKNNDGSVSLQVVESSQINMKDEEQSNILKNSSHFNPVDLVCAIKDYNGKKFNLNNFIDKNTGFISKKSKDGKDLKALELPGLWNGAMSDWNTIFMEVPISTFNPVKTIDDLLRPEHQ